MSSLLWDGSYLGVIPKLTGKWNYGSLHYIQFMYKGDNVFAQAKYVNNTHACVCDELKPIFGVTQNGTHTIHIAKQKRLTVLIIPRFQPNTELSSNPGMDIRLGDLKIDDKRINETLEYKIRLLGVFREIMGLNTDINSIVLGVDNNDTSYKQLIPLSIGENKMYSHLGYNILSKKYKDRWFHKYSFTLSDVASHFFHYNGNNLETVLHDIRIKCEEIIVRVDKSMIYIVNYIVERLKHILVSNEDEDSDMEYNFDDIA